MAKQKVRKETVDIGKIAKASIIGGVSGFLGGDGARVKGSSYGMVTKSINVLNKYTKNNTYSSGTLSMYKTYLTGTKNFLKPIVTKKTTDGYLKGTLATVLGNYGKNIWKRITGR